jgi:hypothetical protein
MFSFARLIRTPHSQASRFWSHRRRPPRNAGSVALATVEIRILLVSEVGGWCVAA